MTILYFLKEISTTKKMYYGTMINKSVVFCSEDLKIMNNLKTIHNGKMYLYNKCISNYKNDTYECVKLVKRQYKETETKCCTYRYDLNFEDDLKEIKDIVMMTDLFVIHSCDVLKRTGMLSLQGIQLQAYDIFIEFDLQKEEVDLFNNLFEKS